MSPEVSPVNDHPLVDVALEHRAGVDGALDRVGMTEIELPVRVPGPHGVQRVPARVDAFVSLDDPTAKGIHMSRLFLLAQETLEKELLTLATLETLARGFVASHRDLSRSAQIDVRFELMLKRPALLSGFRGWRSYPAQLSLRLERGIPRAELRVRVTYSSTCPCSAALARQHVRDRFLERFGADARLDPQRVAAWLESPEGISATPHSQRSHADVRVEVSSAHPPELAELVDRLEACLETPVQAAVKRVDEQEFARRNGTNPMFCEDAARRIHALLTTDERLLGHVVEIEHQESLHAHNAASRVAAGSLRADA
jgi:GTP cyclohydrolase I